MKLATKQLIVCPLLAFLVGVVVAHLMCYGPWALGQNSNQAVPVATVENPLESTVRPHIAPMNACNQENELRAQPTLAFPMVLPPRPKGHVVEVGIKFQNPVQPRATN